MNLTWHMLYRADIFQKTNNSDFDDSPDPVEGQIVREQSEHRGCAADGHQKKIQRVDPIEKVCFASEMMTFSVYIYKTVLDIVLLYQIWNMYSRVLHLFVRHIGRIMLFSYSDYPQFPQKLLKLFGK